MEMRERGERCYDSRVYTLCSYARVHLLEDSADDENN